LADRKPKTPPPPRRVQAPKARAGATDDMGARQRTILYAVAGSGVVALVVVVLIVVLGGGTSSAKAAATTIRAQGCQYKHPKELVATPHFTSVNPTTPPKWNTDPPSSGRHFYIPATFDIYTEPVDEIRLVHNLEHGAMILQYGNKVPASMVADITKWYRDDPNALVVAPYPKLGDKVAMTAWGEWAQCTGFDAKAANAFRSAFRYHGPEAFPKSSLNPGQ
jgi:uncharacterized protein DUF3105